MDNASETSSHDSAQSSGLHSLSELLVDDHDHEEMRDISATPIFSDTVRKHAQKGTRSRRHEIRPFTQYGLLAINISQHDPLISAIDMATTDRDLRIFYNVAAPTSMFICGSQGSGKSHTLGIVLENCLVPCKANSLPRPLTGLVFHYDTFISDTGGLPCEAAYLSSHNGIKVRVLCPPTNVRQIKRIYSHLPNIGIEELCIDQSDLNTKRMLDLMAVSSIQGGGMPLYLHVVTRILREMRVLQQQNGSEFDYGAFRMALNAESLTDGQLLPLQQRLEALESYMVRNQASPSRTLKHKKKAVGYGKASKSSEKGNDWSPVEGQLTVVDLSCPCVTAEMACSLFNICLSLFLEQDAKVGRVVALDEAHKYMTDSPECRTLTESLLSTIRLQRHLGVRVIISTQEPTISPKLLDLCSVAVVHRFTSPDWLQSLKRHLAGISVVQSDTDDHHAKILDSQQTAKVDHASLGSPVINSMPSVASLFSRIVALRTGEAFMFSPGAVVDIMTTSAWHCSNDISDGESSVDNATASTEFVRLGAGVLKVRVRKRITADGGRSVMAQ